DPISTTTKTLKETYKFWFCLLSETTLPVNTRHTDIRWIKAFQHLDAIIGANMPLHTRLAYFRLDYVLESLKASVQADRRCGRVTPVTGRRNANVAMDIYVKAQPGMNHVRLMRKQLNKRLCISKRWARLSGRRPLLLSLYPATAERLVY
ncbi:hypothetical protein QBC35DRAFT_346206, partial [Podospora australis]